MSEISNEIVVSTVDSAALSNKISGMGEGVQGFYSSIEGDDFETKLTVLEAMTDSVPLSENLNKVIEVTNIIVQQVDMLDERTGEMKAQPRVILIDTKGIAYHGISAPLFRDVENWLGMLGKPSTWAGPLPVKITKAGSGNSQYFKASISRSPKK